MTTFTLHDLEKRVSDRAQESADVSYTRKLIDRGVYFLVINLEKVRYIDSTGLGVLIGGLKRVREHGGSVNLVCTNPQIKKIFDITGLVKIFGIFESEDAAMKALV